jgi:DNA modification methylase
MFVSRLQRGKGGRMIKSYVNFLSAQGVWLWAASGLLKWYDPNGVIDNKNLAILARYKAEILPLLKGRKADDFIKQNMNSIILGNNQNILPLFPDNSIDVIITDAPYGYKFKGEEWDKPVSTATQKLFFRKLKPGGWLVLITAPRQDVQLIQMNSVKDAGFEMKFSPLYWTYSSGFTKAHNIGLKVDKMTGTSRQVVGIQPRLMDFRHSNNRGIFGFMGPEHKKLKHRDVDVTIATSPEAKQVDGSYAGFQPKPAVEVILVARKPLSERSCTAQALKDGKGVTHMDDCRIPYVDEKRPERNFDRQKSYSSGQVPGSQGDSWIGSVAGRFPANLLVSDDVLDNEEEKTSVSGKPYLYQDKEYHSKGFLPVTKAKAPANYNDQGGYSRYFSLDAWTEHKLPFLIVPKPTTKEKELGLDNLPSQKVNDGKLTTKDNPLQRDEAKRKNTGPCVKPIKLMAYLVTMFSRPGDICIDPFAGTGSTCIAAKLLGREYIGIEQSEEYHRIAEARLKATRNDNKYFHKLVAEPKKADDKIQEQESDQPEPKPYFFTNDPALSHLNTKGVTK